MNYRSRSLVPYLLACSCGFTLLPGAALLQAADTEAEEEEYSIVFPDELQTRFGALSEAELAFLYTKDALGFVDDEEALFEALEKRSPEEIKAFVVLKAGQAVTEAELLAWGKEQMASYKYP